MQKELFETLYPRSSFKKFPLNKRLEILKSQFGINISHDSTVTCLIVESKKGFVISGSNSGEVTLWDFENKTLKQTFAGHIGYIRAVAISEDRQVLYTGGYDGRVIAWSALEGSLIKMIKPKFFDDATQTTGSIKFIQAGLDNKTLTIVDTEGVLKIWDLIKNTEIFEVSKPEHEVSSTGFRDHKYFIVAWHSALRKSACFQVLNLSNFSIFK